MKTPLTTELLKPNKALWLVVLAFLFYSHVHAQTDEISSDSLSRTNFYSDFGGHFASQISLNIEGKIKAGDRVTWYWRGGVGFVGVIMAFGGPGGLGAVTMLTGKENHHFEGNFGIFVGHDIEHSNAFVMPLIDFGYRYQKPGDGFIFRAKAGLLGIGIGLGYAF